MMDLYCDRCGALGKARFVLANGNDLVFCGHHSRKYQEKLDAFTEEPLSANEPELIGV